MFPSNYARHDTTYIHTMCFLTQPDKDSLAFNLLTTNIPFKSVDSHHANKLNKPIQTKIKTSFAVDSPAYAQTSSCECPCRRSQCHKNSLHGWCWLPPPFLFLIPVRGEGQRSSFLRVLWLPEKHIIKCLS